MECSFVYGLVCSRFVFLEVRTIVAFTSSIDLYFLFWGVGGKERKGKKRVGVVF